MIDPSKTWTAQSQPTVFKDLINRKLRNFKCLKRQSSREEWEVFMHLEDRRPGSIGIIGLLLIVATLAFPVFAAQRTDTTRQELRNFDTFLDSHPGVRAEASENPRILMNRERRFENSGRDIPAAEVQSLDNFLDNHSSIERELRKDPSLANNADYLAKHPELKTYLDQHPLIR